MEEPIMEQDVGPSTSHSVAEIILQSELRTASGELKMLKKEQECAKQMYSIHYLEKVVYMETGTPTECFLDYSALCKKI